MNKTLVFVLIAAGLGAACCLGAGLLLVLGSSEDAVTPAPTSLGPLEGTWLLGYPTVKTWKALRAGEPLSVTSSTMGGGVIELHANGTCERESMLAANNFGCTVGAHTHYGHCSWTMDGDVLALQLEEGTIRSTTCDAASEKTKPANARTERGRAALKVVDGTQYLTFTDLETQDTVDYRRSAEALVP